MAWSSGTYPLLLRHSVKLALPLLYLTIVEAVIRNHFSQKEVKGSYEQVQGFRVLKNGFSLTLFNSEPAVTSSRWPGGKLTGPPTPAVHS